jgi:hypothetical protein
VLLPLELPAAPPVVRSIAAPVQQRRWPAVALVVLGALLVVGPIVGGLFAKVASGQQLIDQFEPHLEADALARYDADLAIIRAGTAGVDLVYDQGLATDGSFPGVDELRRLGDAIDARSSGLLQRIRDTEPDYRDVADIGGFERVPFLVVLAGGVAIYGGTLLLGRTRSRKRPGGALVVLAGLALIAYPFLSDLPSGARAGSRMLDSLAPVMTTDEVRGLQADFVVLVHAVGELDTTFQAVPRPEPAATPIALLVAGWPQVSSDLAELVGTLNDNLDDYAALDDLDGLVDPITSSGLSALPWLLVGLGGGLAALAVAALPRRPKETP